MELRGELIDRYVIRIAFCRDSGVAEYIIRCLVEEAEYEALRNVADYLEAHPQVFTDYKERHLFIRRLKAGYLCCKED